MITPFTLAAPQADLDDLKARFVRVRWTNELPCVGTDYGVPLDSTQAAFRMHGSDGNLGVVSRSM